MKKMKKHRKPHRHGQKWTQKEEDLLEKLYPDMFNFELEDRFGRTIGAMCGKARQLGIIKNWLKHSPARFFDRRLWSQRELKRLKKLFPILPVAQLRVHFPKRSDPAISKKAFLLGLRKNYITSSGPPDQAYLNLLREQKDVLIKLYPTTSNEELAKLLGRTRAAIITHAQNLKLHKACYIPGERNGNGARLWTKEEDALIRKSYPTTWAKDMATQFEERDAKSIQTRAAFLGVKKDPKFKKPNNLWPDEDIQKLRQLWQQGYSRTQIAEMIGKSYACIKHQIRRQIRECGLPERPDPHQWSKKETAYLIKHYENKSARQIGAILGRTRQSIWAKAEKLDLNRTAKPWTTREVNILKKYYNQWTYAKIAKKLGRRTPVAVATKAINLGLNKK